MNNNPRIHKDWHEGYNSAAYTGGVPASSAWYELLDSHTLGETRESDRLDIR